MGQTAQAGDRPCLVARWWVRMAVLEFLRRIRSPADPESVGPPLIGTADDFFPCPRCTRPVGGSDPRCSACGTRLMMRVEMHRALLIGGIGVAVGLFLGAPVGGLMVGIVGSTVGGQTAVATPTPLPLSSGVPGDGGGSIPIPSSVITSLNQAVTINQRLASSLATLKTLRSGKSRVDAVAVADTLRTIAYTANLGAAVAPKLQEWGPTYDLGAGLGSVYASASTVAREALANSMTNEPAYRAAATSMIRALTVLSPLATRSQQLAAAGVVVIPTPEPTAPAPSGSGSAASPAPDESAGPIQ